MDNLAHACEYSLFVCSNVCVRMRTAKSPVIDVILLSILACFLWAHTQSMTAPHQIESAALVPTWKLGLNVCKDGGRCANTKLADHLLPIIVSLYCVLTSLREYTSRARSFVSCTIWREKKKRWMQSIIKIFIFNRHDTHTHTSSARSCICNVHRPPSRPLSVYSFINRHYSMGVYSAKV